MPCRLILAESETLLADLLGAHLATMIPDLQVLPARTNRKLERISADPFDLAIVTLHLDDGDTFGWIERQTEHRGNGRLMVLTTSKQEALIHRMLQLGVTAIVHKSEGLRFIENAILISLAGGGVMSPEIRDVVQRLRFDANSFTRILSNRQRQILAQIGSGRTDREIASVLKISEATVTDHRKNIQAKLGLKGQAQLLGYALEKGFFPGGHLLPGPPETTP